MGLSRLYILFTTLSLNALFLRVGGSGALAVYGVLAMLHRFSTSFIVGISHTLVPLIGVFNEEQDITSVRQTMKAAFFFGNMLMLIIGGVLLIFRIQTAALFGLSADSGLPMAIPFYVIYVLLLLNTTVFSSYYNAVKKLILANVIPFLQEFALLCVGAYILAIVSGINGIWTAFPLSGISTLLILAILLAIIKLKEKDMSIPLLFSRRLERNGHYISFSVESDPAKASEAAAKISEFCEDNGVTPKQTMLISMSVEEIITLIINNSRDKRFSVSVRLFLLDGSIILRIRNTGEKFNAIEYYKANIASANFAEDIEKSIDIIGMKYIVEAAKNVYYRQTFGINSLVVIL